MSIYDAMKNNKNNNINMLDANSERRFVVKYPDIAKEWDYDKNELNIEDMYSTSNKKVWWKCSECGYSWQAYIANRTKRCSGCPKCNEGNQYSFREFALYKIIGEKYNVEYQYKINGMSFDMLIVDLKTVIEYQGRRYHSNKFTNFDVEERDKRKREFIEKHTDYKFITVNETYGGEKIQTVGNDIYFNANNKEIKYIMMLIINELNRILNTELTVREDIETYALSQFKIKNIKESMGSKYPELVEEWDDVKNGYLTPYKVNEQSNKTVWWKCRNCGNEYLDKIVYMTKRNHCCPICKIMLPLKETLTDIYDF